MRHQPEICKSSRQDHPLSQRPSADDATHRPRTRGAAPPLAQKMRGMRQWRAPYDANDYSKPCGILIILQGAQGYDPAAVPQAFASRFPEHYCRLT